MEQEVAEEDRTHLLNESKRLDDEEFGELSFESEHI